MNHPHNVAVVNIRVPEGWLTEPRNTSLNTSLNTYKINAVLLRSVVIFPMFEAWQSLCFPYGGNWRCENWKDCFVVVDSYTEELSYVITHLAMEHIQSCPLHCIWKTSPKIMGGTPSVTQKLFDSVEDLWMTTGFIEDTRLVISEYEREEDI